MEFVGVKKRLYAEEAFELKPKRNMRALVPLEEEREEQVKIL